MQFGAKGRYIRYSPDKLRPLVDVLRGKNVRYALSWLSTYSGKKVTPIRKVIESAAANAKNMSNIDEDNLVIKTICVDRGPMARYFKPGAMGRANPCKKRFSHIKVVLEKIQEA